MKVIKLGELAGQIKSEGKALEIIPILSDASQRPATDSLLGNLADCVKKVREHQHPTRGEDIYCLNLNSYMGERMGAVLKRLDDERAEARKCRDRNTALAEEATGYLLTLTARGEETGTGDNPDA